MVSLRGHRHDRVEVAALSRYVRLPQRSAIQASISATSPGSAYSSRQGGRRYSRVSLPSASSVSAPVGVKKAGTPAPAARMRSASVPCGTISSLQLAALAQPRRRGWRARTKLQITLRTRPSSISRACPAMAPPSRAAGGFDDEGEVAWRPARSARRAARCGMPTSPKPAEQHGGAVRDARHGIGHGHEFVDHQAAIPPGVSCAGGTLARGGVQGRAPPAAFEASPAAPSNYIPRRLRIIARAGPPAATVSTSRGKLFDGPPPGFRRGQAPPVLGYGGPASRKRPAPARYSAWRASAWHDSAWRNSVCRDSAWRDSARRDSARRGIGPSHAQDDRAPERGGLPSPWPSASSVSLRAKTPPECQDSTARGHCSRRVRRLVCARSGP